MNGGEPEPYPLVERPDGRWEQTAPQRCPRGHRLGPLEVLVGFAASPLSPQKMICWTCATCGSVTYKDGSVKVTGQD
jgi:hypothetical protein